MTMTQPIRTKSRPTCFLCGATGELLYTNLTDRLFNAPGVWQTERCTRAECGLLWLDPVPIDEDIGEVYREYYTHEEAQVSTGRLRSAYAVIQQAYWRHRFGYRTGIEGWKRWLALLAYLHPGRREEMDSAVMYLHAQPGARLLEVGCGSGARLKLLGTLDWNVEGVEVDAIAVRRCTEQGLTVRLGSLHEQRFAPSTFDVVVMNHVIEHVVDPQSLLQEIRRVLIPGGVLVVTTPNAASWAHQRFKQNWVALDPPRHLHLFNLQTLQELVRRAGFTVQNARTTIRGAAWVFLASRAIQRNSRFSMTEAVPRWWRRWGRAMEFAELFVLKSNRQAGEQITLIAKAP
jgi:2-polyprenyl-3-methyl-5-hydroxy-6-metoxy-1,4-benzoquinol methylase